MADGSTVHLRGHLNPLSEPQNQLHHITGNEECQASKQRRSKTAPKVLGLLRSRMLTGNKCPKDIYFYLHETTAMGPSEDLFSVYKGNAPFWQMELASYLRRPLRKVIVRPKSNSLLEIHLDMRTAWTVLEMDLKSGEVKTAYEAL